MGSTNFMYGLIKDCFFTASFCEYVHILDEFAIPNIVAVQKNIVDNLLISQLIIVHVG